MGHDRRHFPTDGWPPTWPRRSLPFIGTEGNKRQLLLDIGSWKSAVTAWSGADPLREKHNIRIKEIQLEDVSHVMKEEKLGIIRGFAERLKMYRDIVKVLSFKER